MQRAKCSMEKKMNDDKIERYYGADQATIWDYINNYFMQK